MDIIGKYRHTTFNQGMVAEVSKLVEKEHGKAGKELGSIAMPLDCGPPFLTTTNTWDENVVLAAYLSLSARPS